MRIGTQFKKLQKKIETEKEFKQKSYNERSGGYLYTDLKRRKHKKKKMQTIKDKLDFLKFLLDIINEGATGFELAYKVEKNQDIKSLIYDGILFYNTFIEIGNKKFLNAPDKVKVDYRSFKTIEDTEKYIFMVWLKDMITSLKKKIQPTGDYVKFIEAKKAQEIRETMKKLRERLTHCKNCGALIQSKEQLLCEECGKNLMEITLQK
jgi:tRNA(Ile2) C34 agmatinyltransferase TiaS